MDYNIYEILWGAGLSVGGIVLTFLLTTLRGKMAKQDEHIESLREQISDIKVAQASNHYTKDEVRAAVESAVAPIRETLRRIEGLLMSGSRHG